MAHISLLQHWEHSIRMGSPAGAVGSALNALGSTVYGPKQWRTKVESVIGRHALRRGQLRLDGSLLDIPPTAPPYIAGLLRLDEYETAERYAIAKFLPRSIPVIEFGAGIGAIACLTNRLLRDRSQHWVVEANPAMIPVLTGNRDRNGAGFHVCHGALAYDSTGFVSVEVDAAVLETHVDNPSASTAHVPAVTLTDLVRRSRFSQFSLVCDVEGAEAELMSRESEVVAEHVRAMVIEMHPARLGTARVNALADQLNALGFVREWGSGDVWFMKKTGAVLS